MMKIKKICEQCGKEFERLLCNMPETKGRFCSQPCYYKHQKKNYHQCLFCGKRDYNRKRENKYCSYEHFLAHKKHLSKAYCCECGKEFRKGGAGKQKNQKHCSKKCAYKAEGRKKIFLKNRKDWRDESYVFNCLKGQMFGKGYKLNALDKMAVKANVLIHKIRRSLNVSK